MLHLRSLGIGLRHLKPESVPLYVELHVVHRSCKAKGGWGGGVKCSCSMTRSQSPRLHFRFSIIAVKQKSLYSMRH